MELRAGLLPWSFFARAVVDASNSLIGKAKLISKVYTPRSIVPIAAGMVAFVDFLISFAILVALMIWYQFTPGWQILLLPLFVAIGVWICAQRQILRLPLRRPVHCPIRPLCVASRIQRQHRPGSVAACLLPQSDGRGDRWVSLVPAWGPERAVFARFVAQPGSHGLLRLVWHPAVQKNGKELADLI